MRGDLFAYLPPARFAISAQQPLSIGTPRIERPVAEVVQKSPFVNAVDPTPGRGGFLKSYDVAEGGSVRRIHVRTKREAWALDCLRAAGEDRMQAAFRSGPKVERLRAQAQAQSQP